MSYWPPVLLFFFYETWVWGDGSSPSEPVQDWQCLRSSIILITTALLRFFLSPNIFFVTVLLFTCNMYPITEIKCEISQCLGLFFENYRKCYEIHSRSLQTLLILESSNVHISRANRNWHSFRKSVILNEVTELRDLNNCWDFCKLWHHFHCVGITNKYVNV